MSKWRWRVRTFLPPNRGGGVACETMHSSEASKQIEVIVIRERIHRGELSHAIVVDLDDPFRAEMIAG